MTSIKREEIGIIIGKLDETTLQLQKGNVYSCLIKFREVLEKTLHTRMLSQDKKELYDRIFAIQNQLSESRAFRNAYGPVTFRDADIETTLDFVKQLLQVMEDEIKSPMADQQPEVESHLQDSSSEVSTEELIKLMEEDDYTKARELIGDDEELLCSVINFYNARGIQLRMQGQFDKAVNDFKRALEIYSNDEGLYYNVARAYMGKQEWVAACDAIKEALKINPVFAEGLKLLDYIRRHHPQQS